MAVAAENWAPTGPIFGSIASPASLPRLAAVGAKTSRIEISMIDMRYENPFYMAEDGGAADLIAAGVCS